MFGASSRHDRVFYDGFDRQAAHLLSASQKLTQVLQNGHLGQNGQSAQNGAAEGPARDQMRALRQQADESSRALIGELRKTWITPFDPQEIRELVASMDSVLSLIHGALERLVGFQLTGKNEAQIAGQLADILHKCCDALARGLNLLREKKRETEILEACEEVQRLNRHADEVYRAALPALYDGAGQNGDGDGDGEGTRRADGVASVLRVLKWHEVFDKLDEATTRCSRSAMSIETVVSGRT